MRKSRKAKLGLAVLGAIVSACLAAQAPGVRMPYGTKLDPLQIGQRRLALHGPAAVAFLFVANLADEEGQCADKFFGGPGRLCTLRELVAGIKAGGGVIGLNRNPAEDRNYQYKLTLIGQDCLIVATPRHAGLPAFAFIGNPKFNGDFYYSAAGQDLRHAEKINGEGYSGPGFKR